MNETEELQAALREIAAANAGRLTPETVVDIARSEASPLHRYFEWDTAKAAEAYRLDQARTLIRSVRVEIHTESRVIRTVAYVRDPRLPHDEQGYVAVAEIRGDADLAREALLSEFSRAASVLGRARELAAAFGLADQVERIERSVMRVKKRAESSVVAMPG